MSWEAVSALSALGTLIVVAGSAIAAIAQIRHLRVGNQINAAVTLLERWSSREFREMSNFVFDGRLDEKLKDPKYRAELERPTVDRLAHPEVALCDVWEQIGTVVKLGHASEETFIELVGFICIDAWNKLSPVIAIIRRTRGPFAYDNFEYVASRAMMWEARHPHGTYPQGTPHLPVAAPWREET
jgi:hypothetical protein